MLLLNIILEFFVLEVQRRSFKEEGFTSTLRSLLNEQAELSEQGGIFLKIVQRAG